MAGAITEISLSLKSVAGDFTYNSSDGNIRFAVNVGGNGTTCTGYLIFEHNSMSELCTIISSTLSMSLSIENNNALSEKGNVVIEFGRYDISSGVFEKSTHPSHTDETTWTEGNDTSYSNKFTSSNNSTYNIPIGLYPAYRIYIESAYTSGLINNRQFAASLSNFSTTLEIDPDFSVSFYDDSGYKTLLKKFDWEGEHSEMLSYTPTKDGYRFMGWTFDGVNIITSNILQTTIIQMTPYYQNICLYAVWEEVGSNVYLGSSLVDVYMGTTLMDIYRGATLI